MQPKQKANVQAIDNLLFNKENKLQLNVKGYSSFTNVHEQFDKNLGMYTEKYPIQRIHRVLGFIHYTEFTKDIDRNHPELTDYKSRIEFLEEEGKLEDIELSKASMYDFCSFIKFIQNKTGKKLRTGSLFLLDNGDLRVLWADNQDSQVGLQFLGYGILHYVIFGRHLSEQQISCEADTVNFKEVCEKIDSFELDSVLYE